MKAQGQLVGGRFVAPLRWLLGYDGIPYLARSTFRYELLSGVFTAVAGAALLPELAQLFAKNSLHASDWILSVLVAGAAAGNFFSAFFAQHIQRRRRVPFIVACRLAIAAVLVGLGFLPATRAAAGWFAGILLIPAVLGAVALNAQSGIWHTNYPAHLRGRIFSRLLVLRLAITAVTVKLAGYALDRWPMEAHHIVFPVAAAAMVAGALFFSRVRVRGEAILMREGLSQPVRLLAGFRVLWEDRDYGRYMLWQMISGGSLLMVMPVIVPSLKAAFDVNYAQGTTMMVLAPFTVEVLTAPLAGHMFDHIGIMKFRAINATLWAMGRLGIYVALLMQSWPVALAGFAVQGLAASTGGVVWNIGHTRFAPPGQSQLYMGIHMTLQGIRGLTLPFLGMALYHIPWIGVHVMAVGVAIQLLAAVEFLFCRPPRASVAAVAADGQDNPA